MAGSRPFDIDSLDEDTLEVARAAADAAGMSLEDWLARTLGEPPADGSGEPADAVPPQTPPDPDLTIVAPLPSAGREELEDPATGYRLQPHPNQPEPASPATPQDGTGGGHLHAALHALAGSLATATADPRWAVRIDTIRRATAATVAAAPMPTTAVPPFAAAAPAAPVPTTDTEPAAPVPFVAEPFGAEPLVAEPLVAEPFGPQGSAPLPEPQARVPVPEPEPVLREPRLGPSPDVPPAPFIAPEPRAEPSRQLAELPTGGELEKAIAAAQARRRIADENGGVLRRKRASGGFLVQLLIGLVALASLAVIALLAYLWANPDRELEEVVGALSEQGEELYDAAARQVDSWLGNPPADETFEPDDPQEAIQVQPVPEPETIDPPAPGDDGAAGDAGEAGTPGGSATDPAVSDQPPLVPDLIAPDAPDPGPADAGAPDPAAPAEGSPGSASAPGASAPGASAPGASAPGASAPGASAPGPSGAEPQTDAQTETPTTTELAELQRDAEAGDPAAQRELGLRYLDGDGVAPDPAAAHRWLEEASIAGDAEAQYIIGTLYEDGIGTERDPLIAMTWYLSASESGMPEAAMRMGEIYRDGDLWPQSYPDAAEQFRIAADAGMAEAEYELANLYSTGQGVDHSPLLAHLWYSRAAEHGHSDAAAQAAAIAGSLTPEQLTQSEQLAADPPPTGTTLYGAEDSAVPADAAAPDVVPTEQATPSLNAADSETAPPVAPVPVESPPTLVPEPEPATAENRVPTSDLLAETPPAADEEASDLLPASPLSQDAILEIQTLLDAHGYSTGRPDGIAGRRTQDAIRAYQTAEGLPVTGQPSLTLLARLRSQGPP